MDHLTEPGIRQYLLDSFQQCKEYKMNYYTKLLNIGLFILFVCLLASILYMKKKEKLTPQQKIKKNEEDRTYIMNKIRSLSQPMY
jgi:Na+-transporting NADH:ubiquinone oxidoreductase subunit NqrC